MRALSTRQQKSALLIKHLNQFGKLSDNWDNFGGVAPAAAIISITAKLIKQLPDSFILSFKKDDLFANPNGTLSLIWQTERGEFFIEIGEPVASWYLKLDGQIVFHNDALSITDNEFVFEINDQLRRLYPKPVSTTWTQPARQPAFAAAKNR